MRIVEQQTAHEARHKIWVLNGESQMRQLGLDVPDGERVGIVQVRREAVEQQLQTVGIAVAADLALAQLELMQHRLDFTERHALLGDLRQRIQNQLLDRRRMLRLRTFYASRKSHLTIIVIEPTQGRWRLAKLGGFKNLPQR